MREACCRVVGEEEVDNESLSECRDGKEEEEEEEEEPHDHASDPEFRLLLQIKRIVNRPRKKDSALRSMTAI